MLTKITLAFATPLIVLTAFANAQDMPEGFSVGLGAAVSNGPYIGEDEGAAALPLLSYSSSVFSVSTAQGLRFTLLDRQALRVSAVLSPRYAALADTDAPELASLDREITADGGELLEYSLSEQTKFSARAVTELTDEHGGQEVTLSASQMLFVGNFPLMLGGGVSWQSAELAEYVYGVSSTEASGGLSAYAPGEIVVPYVTIGTVIPMSDSIAVMGSLRIEILPDEVTASPIIDEDLNASAMIGVMYRF